LFRNRESYGRPPIGFHPDIDPRGGAPPLGDVDRVRQSLKTQAMRMRDDAEIVQAPLRRDEDVTVRWMIFHDQGNSNGGGGRRLPLDDCPCQTVGLAPLRLHHLPFRLTVGAPEVELHRPSEDSHVKRSTDTIAFRTTVDHRLRRRRLWACLHATECLLLPHAMQEIDSLCQASNNIHSRMALG
jgi:hypothetical protein